MYDWTSERDKMLLATWNGGAKIAQIKQALGGRVSEASIRARLQVLEKHGNEVVKRSRGRHDYYWTEARLAKLQELLDEGLTHAKIGQKFIRDGKPIGRGAIIMAVFRMKKKAK